MANSLGHLPKESSTARLKGLIILFRAPDSRHKRNDVVHDDSVRPDSSAARTPHDFERMIEERAQTTDDKVRGTERSERELRKLVPLACHCC